MNDSHVESVGSDSCFLSKQWWYDIVKTSEKKKIKITVS